MNKVKRILLVGGTGFIGKALRKGLDKYDFELLGGRELLSMRYGDIIKKLQEKDIVINLAGSPVIKRWTPGNRRLIMDSRIRTTDRLVSAILDSKLKIHYISASAIGIYSEEGKHDESSQNYANNFLSEVVQKWEKEIKRLEKSSGGYTIMRIGIVLGISGGAYAMLRKLTGINLGAYFNGGRQSLSFICLHDMVNAVDWIIEKEISGVVNLSAPNPSDYKHLMELLRKKTRALIIWNIPAFILKLIFGKASVMFLEGQNVLPGVLLKNNFNFKAPNIETCIENIESR